MDLMGGDGLQRLISAHERFPTVVGGLIQGVDLEILRDRESAGCWSPLEILAHLRDEEVEDFRTRARAAYEQLVVEWNLNPAEWVTERSYNRMDPELVLADLTAERERSCRWLRGLSPDGMDRSLVHPRFGIFRCGDFIAAWRMHDLVHLRQLATALAVVTARRLAGWRLEYAGAVPGQA